MDILTSVRGALDTLLNHLKIELNETDYWDLVRARIKVREAGFKRGWKDSVRIEHYENEWLIIYNELKILERKHGICT